MCPWTNSPTRVPWSRKVRRDAPGPARELRPGLNDTVVTPCARPDFRSPEALRKSGPTLAVKTMIND